MRRAHRFSWQCRPAVHGVTPAESRAESASESESEQMKSNGIFENGGGGREPHLVVAARSRKSLGHVYHQKYSARGPLHESESESEKEVLQHARTNSIFGSGGGVRDPHQVVAARSRKSLGHVYHQKYSARWGAPLKLKLKLGAGQKKKKSPHLDSGVGTFLIRIDVKKRLPADVKGVPEKILASTTT